MLAAILDSNTGIVLLTLLAVIGFIIFMSLEQKWRANKEMKQKNLLIQKQSRLIHRKNLKLEGQNKLLKDLNEEKTNLISVVSHDLKSPLNRIYALTSLIKMESESLTEEQLDYIEKMNQVVLDGMDLIKNLLDYRALDENVRHIDLYDVNIEAVINEIDSSFSGVAQSKRIEVVKSINVPSAIVKTDEQYFKRILENLISNAIKFSPFDKKVFLDVFEKDDFLVVNIRDQGPGIIPSDRPMLYKKFKVLSSQPTNGENSTGLGLALSKAFAKKLGGQLFLDEQNEKGASFFLEIPLVFSAVVS